MRAAGCNSHTCGFTSRCGACEACGATPPPPPARRQLVDATSSGGEGTGKTTELKTKGTFTHRGLAVPASTAGPGVIGAMAGVTAVLTALAAFRYLTTRTFKPATHLAPTKSGAYEADESSVAIETEKLHHRRQSRTSDDTVTD